MAYDSVTSPARAKGLIIIMVKSRGMGESDTDGKSLPWTPAKGGERTSCFAYVFCFGVCACVCVCVACVCVCVCVCVYGFCNQ